MAERDEFITLIATILELEPDSVSYDADLEGLGWDSLSDLSFIAESDSRWGVVIDPKALSDSVTPEDLLALVNDPAS